MFPCATIIPLSILYIYMEQRTFTRGASAVFFLIAMAHLFRITQGWQVMISQWNVPFSFSYAVVLVAGIFALYGVSLSGKH